MTYTADRLRSFGYRFDWEPDWSLSTSHADHYGPDSAYEGLPDGEPQQCEGVVLYDNHGSIVGSLGCIDDADDDYRAQVEDDLAAEVVFPVANRASVAEARRAFNRGQLVLISDNCLHRTTYALGPWTQTHDKTRITWDELDGMRKSWGKPQRYYIVPGGGEQVTVEEWPIVRPGGQFYVPGHPERWFRTREAAQAFADKLNN